MIGLGCVFSSIAASDNVQSFFNLPSIFITIGGTIGSVVMAFPPKRLKLLGSVMHRAFQTDKSDPVADVNTLVQLADVARREGLLALDRVIGEYTDDPFIKRGLMLIVDGADEEQLRYSLEGDTYYMQHRHKEGSGMLEMIAATAPALGLMGTYIGLIPMLCHLEDPTKLGPLMALELVTSFYGAFIAYVIFSPLAKRLKNMNGEEVLHREIVIEGLAGIQQGKNPRVIHQDLMHFLNCDEEYKPRRKGGAENGNDPDIFVKGKVS